MRWCLFALLALVAHSAAGIAGDPSLSAVKVVRSEGGGVEGSGSGTVIRSDGARSWVLTNRHVAPDGRHPLAVVVCGTKIPATWVQADDMGDLAVVVVDADLIPAELASDLPPVGAPVRQYGFPGGSATPVPKAGQVLAGDGGREMGGAPIWRSSVDSRPGDSGAAVFHDGRIVAVNWGRPANPYASEQLACPLPNVRRFLRKLLLCD